jgi:hypothetical protein
MHGVKGSVIRSGHCQSALHGSYGHDKASWAGGVGKEKAQNDTKEKIET